ncbi:MAG: toprim domain-containing protein [Actinomycetota bacterium]|nr:toprim domain-containing protein [Actinomycetota bacterium]
MARRTGLPVSDGQAGSMTVRCPMPGHGHPDRTPSLRLHLDNDLWFCFGCSPRKADGNPVGADVVEWVSQSEGVGWREAVAVLDSGRPLTNAWAGAGLGARAARYLDRTAGEGNRVAGAGERPDLGRTRAERVRQALRAAWGYYSCDALHERGDAYLTGRGIQVGWLEEHTGRREVGHTPAQRDGLVRRLSGLGFSPDELVDAGLAHRSIDAGRLDDYYRQRVLVPVRDGAGQMAGFIGRNVGDPRWPKYKNPPRTHLYDKSENLYQPLPPPAADGQVVVVEGTLDAMAIAVAALQTGSGHLFCPVTQSGRELSPEQLGHVLGLHGAAPVIAFDGDAPGIDSNVRVAVAAAERGCEALVVILPDGHDPASWLAAAGPSGIAAWSRAKTASPSGAARPVPAGGLWAQHEWNTMREAADRAGRRFDRKTSLAALVQRANDLHGRLPGPAAHRWARAAGEPLGRMAVAEAVERRAVDDRPDLQAVVGRTCHWAQLLPTASLDTFARGAAVAVEATGAASLRAAQQMLSARLAPQVSTAVNTAATVAAGVACGPAL